MPMVAGLIPIIIAIAADFLRRPRGVDRMFGGALEQIAVPASVAQPSLLVRPDYSANRIYLIAS